ncbi:MAG: dUTP diphosphatase [Bacilli bacterium]|nr:dUTP diphosphatase [Bacilli bacterium]
MRGFKFISIKEYTKTRNEEDYLNLKIPSRGTNGAAGYDFYLPYNILIKPKSSVVISSGIKAYMENDEFLMIVIRSSLGFKKGLRLRNQVGIIDSDYFDNVTNEGHILIAMENTTDQEITLNKGDRIAQGIFLKYLKVDEEKNVDGKRTGGIGSTNK